MKPNQVSRLRGEVATLQQERAPLVEQIDQLTRERDAAARRLAALREQDKRANRDKLELLQLRGEVTRLRQQAQELAALKAAQRESGQDPTASAVKSWLTRVELLKQRLAQVPGAAIPEFRLLTEEDWLSAAKNELNSETDYRKALSALRNKAESTFAGLLQPALHSYLQDHDWQFPADLSELRPHFKSPVEDAMLERYAIIPAEELGSLKMGGERIITQKAPLDDEFDARIGIGPNGYGTTGAGSFKPSKWDELKLAFKALEPLRKAFAAANNGKEPVDPSQLLPFATTPEEQAALQQILELRREATE